MLLNINETVRVKLTEFGKQVYRENHDKLRTEVLTQSKGRVDLGPFVQLPDGWSNWQLWALMSMFGPWLGSTSPFPFETSIDIPTATLKTHYEGAEQECSNLRKHLAWAATFLPREQVLELKKRIEGPLDEGGVVRDGVEDEAEEREEFQKLCVQAAELLREVINSPGTELSSELDTKNWGGRAEAVASRLMEYDPPTPEASLAVIRNTRRPARG